MSIRQMLDEKFELREGRVDSKYVKNLEFNNRISDMNLQFIFSYNVITRKNLLVDVI